MANIKIELDYPLEDGMTLTFKAPCDCTAITGVKVYYPEITETSNTIVSKIFTFKDTHLNDLNGLGNLFMSGATVKVVVDMSNGHAFIQNADTNRYLENRLNAKANASHTHSNYDSHISNKSNPHGVTVAQIGAATTFTKTVSVDTSWTTDTTNGGYTKTVTISGITGNDNPTVDVVLGTDVEANKLCLKAWGCVDRIATNDRGIVLYAYDNKPETAFNIQLKVVR